MKKMTLEERAQACVDEYYHAPAAPLDNAKLNEWNLKQIIIRWFSDLEEQCK